MTSDDPDLKTQAYLPGALIARRAALGVLEDVLCVLSATFAHGSVHPVVSEGDVVRAARALADYIDAGSPTRAWARGPVRNMMDAALAAPHV
ncbi:MAG: hypothetical protein ACREDH_15005 [Methylocella sp.]